MPEYDICANCRAKREDCTRGAAPIIDAIAWDSENDNDLVVSARCGVGVTLIDKTFLTHYPAGLADGDWRSAAPPHANWRRVACGIFPSEAMAAANPLFLNEHGCILRYIRQNSINPSCWRLQADAIVGYAAAHSTAGGLVALAYGNEDADSTIAVFTGVHLQRPPPRALPPKTITGNVTAIAWSNSGRYLAAGTDDGRVFLNDAPTEKGGSFSQIAKISGPVTSLSWAVKDFTVGISGPNSDSVAFHSVKTVISLPAIPQGEVVKIDLGDLNTVATRVANGDVAVWERTNGGWQKRQDFTDIPHASGSIDTLGEIRLNAANDQLAAYSAGQRAIAVRKWRP